MKESEKKNQSNLLGFFKATEPSKSVGQLVVKSTIDDAFLAGIDPSFHQPDAVFDIVISSFQNETKMNLGKTGIRPAFQNGFQDGASSFRLIGQKITNGQLILQVYFIRKSGN